MRKQVDMASIRKVVRWSHGQRHERHVAPAPFTPDRAREINTEARARTRFGPWECGRMRVMSDREISFVMAVWDECLGHHCWNDAFRLIETGRVVEVDNNGTKVWAVEL